MGDDLWRELFGDPAVRAVVRLIADRVRRGDSLATIAKATGIPNSTLKRLARMAGIRYKHQHATPEQIKAAIAAVTKQGMTFRAAGAKHGMSKTAVHRFVQRRRIRAVDAVGPVKFRHERQQWRCPEHGWVQFRPCVMCVAEGKAT